MTNEEFQKAKQEIIDLIDNHLFFYCENCNWPHEHLDINGINNIKNKLSNLQPPSNGMRSHEEIEEEINKLSSSFYYDSVKIKTLELVLNTENNNE